MSHISDIPRSSTESVIDAEDGTFLLARSSISTSPGMGHTESTMQDHTTMGAVRAYWLGVLVCMGGFLFGYDSGIVGGVLTLPSFEKDFAYSKHQATKTQSLTVSLQQLGAFVACFFIWPVTHRIGRRKSLMLCSTVFCIGVIIQTANTGSLPAFYVARVIAGLGLGGATVVIPMSSSKTSPKHLRGQIGCFFQLFYTLGIFTSYWLDYGVKKDLKPVSKQWQIPIGLQLVPGALLGLGMLTLKESVRWHMQRGEYDSAWKSLVWIRASDGGAVREEFEEIKAGVTLEARQTEGFKMTGQPLPTQSDWILGFLCSTIWLIPIEQSSFSHIISSSLLQGSLCS